MSTGRFVAPGPINVQGIIQFGVQVNPGINFTVPEPSALALLAGGAALLLTANRSRRRRRRI